MYKRRLHKRSQQIFDGVTIVPSFLSQPNLQVITHEADAALDSMMQEQSEYAFNRKAVRLDTVHSPAADTSLLSQLSTSRQILSSAPVLQTIRSITARPQLELSDFPVEARLYYAHSGVFLLSFLVKHNTGITMIVLVVVDNVEVFDLWFDLYRDGVAYG